MAIKRRDIIISASAMALHPLATSSMTTEGNNPMYGLIGKMIAISGARDELGDILVNGIAGMPGCLSYIVARDSSDENALWVTEVWENQEMHTASLSLPSVQAAIAKGKPLIAGFAERFETMPIGGQGI